MGLASRSSAAGRDDQALELGAQHAARVAVGGDDHLSASSASSPRPGRARGSRARLRHRAGESPQRRAGWRAAVVRWRMPPGNRPARAARELVAPLGLDPSSRISLVLGADARARSSSPASRRLPVRRIVASERLHPVGRSPSTRQSPQRRRGSTPYARVRVVPGSPRRGAQTRRSAARALGDHPRLAHADRAGPAPQAGARRSEPVMPAPTISTSGRVPGVAGLAGWRRPR